MNIVTLGGSLRAASLNRRLLRHLSRHLSAQQHEVVSFEGEALRWPLYEDNVAVPEGARDLQTAMLKAQGVVIVSPEYNAGIPGHLKNVVDWLSTVSPSPWKDRPVLLCSASPGAFGGARAMLSWRATLANMGALAFPASINVPLADKNLDEEGVPRDPLTVDILEKTVGAFLALTAKVHLNGE
jgi:chromate reductase